MDNVIKILYEKLDIPSDPIILDLGGGTGLNRPLVKNINKYICLDLDYKKLQKSLARKGKIDPVLADAIRIPIKDDSIDLLLLTSVSHHISDELLPEILREIRRVLTPGGQFLLYDPIFSRNNILGTFFWKFDLGTHPRTKSELLHFLSMFFMPSDIIELKIIHSYLVYSGICKPITV